MSKFEDNHKINNKSFPYPSGLVMSTQIKSCEFDFSDRQLFRTETNSTKHFKLVELLFECFNHNLGNIIKLAGSNAVSKTIYTNDLRLENQ
jgi:hypothetical protein